MTTPKGPMTKRSPSRVPGRFAGRSRAHSDGGRPAGFGIQATEGTRTSPAGFCHPFVIPVWSLVIHAATAFCSPASAESLDTVRFRREGTAQAVSGRILVRAQDGGLLLESRDGILWALAPAEIVSAETSGSEFAPLDQERFTNSLLKDLPTGFQSYETAHYAICYDTSRDYAAWCGGMFERLYRAFINFWSRRGFELHDPPYPLPVIIFSDPQKYAAFAEGELGDAANSIAAYYSLRTNRVIMYDLTGVEAVRSQGRARRGRLSINMLLSQPAAEPLVATVVHEATHQIAFNSGLHTRYTDVPLWLSEGLAIYFETPDLSTNRGWTGIGRVNRRRLATLRRNPSGRGPDHLERLVASDHLFRDTRTGPEAYAQAWALTHYLLRAREDDYVAYLKALSKKPRLVWDDEATRLAEFRKHFGNNFATLNAQLHEYIARLR